MDGSAESNAASTYVEIGRQFVQHYYTMLAERPNDAHRYYGDKSILTHNGKWAIGSEDIQKAIDDSKFHDSKFRIYSIKGAPTLANGVAIQVVGEISTADTGLRKFSQTFVLGQQITNKFYIFNDIFTFSDQLFGKESESAEATSTPAPLPETKLNGHTRTPQKKEQQLTVDNERHQELPSPINSGPKTPNAKKVPERSHDKQRGEPPCDPAPPKQQVQQQAPPPQQQQQQPVQPAVPAQPRSWAAIAGHNSSTAPTNPAPVAAPTRAITRPTNSLPNSQPTPHAKQDEESRTLHVKNIGYQKEKLSDEDVSAATAEIISYFSEFGPVDSFKFPISNFGAQRRSDLYGFLVMKLEADAQKILEAAGKTEGAVPRGLKVDVPSFNFSGEIFVDRGRRTNDNRGRGGYARGGSFRGGPRAPGAHRGNFRGNHMQ
ncbi:unnamed protein product, partial [Mesorhabditis spiculigera]